MTRILVAPGPRMYREAIAHVVRGRRPHVEVRTAEPEYLDAETVRFSPDLGTESLDANIRVDHSTLSKVKQVELADILDTIDETEQEVWREGSGR